MSKQEGEQADIYTTTEYDDYPGGGFEDEEKHRT